MTKLITTTSILFLCLSATTKSAQGATVEGFEIKGYVEGYYEYNFNSPPASKPISNSGTPADADLPDSNNKYRYYDTYHNQLALNLVEITIAKKWEEVSFFTDLDFGPFADLNATNGAVEDSLKNIGQAVVNYRPKDFSRLSFDFGKMVTHVGYETMKAKDNFQYSKSILFSYGMPFYHTGLRVGYDVAPEALTTSLYIYNGWNSSQDNNKSKTLGAQIKFTPNKDLSFIYNFIGGPERTNNEGDAKVIHEFNVNYILTSSTTVGFDVLYGYEENVAYTSPDGSYNYGGNAHWYGGLLLIKHDLNTESYISPRIEYYQDREGYTLGVNGKMDVATYTFTYARKLTSNFETKLEVRHDKASVDIFPKNNSDFSNSQTTALLGISLVL